MTLCIALKDNQILLGFKKRGFGAGRWNGFGGKVHEGEDIEVAARREIKEEAGVQIVALEHVVVLDFVNQPQQGETIIMHIFRVDEFIGEPKETEEMRPQWFDVKEIPYAHMWPDDPFWLPLFLQGKKFKGKFVFEGDIITEHSIYGH